MEQRGFTGAGFTGDEHVLGDAAAELEELKTGCAKAADGDLQIIGARARPEFLRGWGDGVEIDLDALGFFGANADDVENPGQKILGRRRIERSG